MALLLLTVSFPAHDMPNYTQAKCGLANIQTYNFTQPPKWPHKFQQHNIQVNSLKSLCQIWVIDCRGRASVGMEEKREAQEWGKGPGGTAGG